MAQKNISIKINNKKHHRENLCGALSLYMSMIFSSILKKVFCYLNIPNYCCYNCDQNP